MIVVLASDSHDNIHLIKKFVEQALALKPELVLHAGDYSAPFAAKAYEPLGSKLKGVFGNNDAERELLKERFASFGAQVEGEFLEVEVGGRRIAVLHGHRQALLKSLIDLSARTGYYDVVVRGHTHRFEVREIGKTLVVNPGEICGYLSGECTFAVLDLKELKIEKRQIL